MQTLNEGKICGDLDIRRGPNRLLKSGKGGTPGVIGPQNTKSIYIKDLCMCECNIMFIIGRK